MTPKRETAVTGTERSAILAGCRSTPPSSFRFLGALNAFCASIKTLSVV